jgi:hypothetical protein
VYGARPELQIRFTTGAVFVDNGSAGAEVVLLEMVHQPRKFYSARGRRDRLATADQSGTARFPLDDTVADHSVWIACDSRTGEVAAAAAPGFPLRRTTQPESLVQSREEFDLLSIPYHWAEVLVIRPGVGAWGQSVVRGGPNDANRGRGRMLLRPESLHNVAGQAAAPSRMRVGDLAVVVNLRSFEFFIWRFAPGNGGSGQ